MIVPMKKIAVVVLEREKRDALRALRRMGAVHVEKRPAAGDDLEALQRKKALCHAALGHLTGLKGPAPECVLDPAEATAVAERIVANRETARTLRDRSAADRRELDRLAPWGDFDPADLRDLAARGIVLKLYELSPFEAARFPEDVPTIPLPASRGVVRFAAVLRRGEEAPAGIPGFAPPAEPAAVVERRAALTESELREADRELRALCIHADNLRGEVRHIDQDLEFETVRAGMPASGPLAHLTGYIPLRRLDDLKALARERGWGVLADDPGASDGDVPTLVENNAFVRIIQPVFDFLGTVPGYREYDTSLWFLIFFCAFFAMIFGDAGYGALILGGAAWAAFRAKRRGGPVPDGVRLFLLVGAATLLWGAAIGSWFSLPAAKLPGFLRALVIPAFAGANPLGAENIKRFCFILGTVQLSIAHLKNIKRDFPGLKCIAQAGWLVCVLGLYFLVLNLVLDAKKFPVPAYSLYMIGGGFLAVLVFGNYEGSLKKSLAAGLAGALPQFLSTVGAFSDIISYIRLFAVGLAGVAISQTVNGMGLGMGGRLLGLLAGGLILFLGHALNLAMSGLSVIVHGVRLNMLEFSGHLGMEWSGIPYDPFRVRIDNDKI
jgi:V/A-type H+-transporting ATPase subunit I